MLLIDSDAPPTYCCFCGGQIYDLPLDVIVSPGEPDGNPKKLLAHNDCFKQRLHPSAQYISWHDVVDYS